MKTNKIYWALISVRSGDLKEVGNCLTPIYQVKPSNLLTFNKRKEAKEFIEKKCAWALRPIKVSFDGTKLRFELSL